MSDWRYHVASLSAVLLGIAVGLLIGGLYLSPAVPDQIAAQLRRLDEQLAQRTAELRETEAERDLLRQALMRTDSVLARLLPATMPQRLKGRRVALLITTDERSVAQGVEQLLTDASAELTGTIRIEWAQADPEERRIILNNLPELFGGGATASMLTVLRRRDGVSLLGDYARPPDVIVWVGGYTRRDASDEWLQADSELIAALQSALHRASPAPRLVACEAFATRLSIIPLCKAADVPSVDCVDLALGKGALMALLRGESGTYGLKPTADAAVPDALLERAP